MRTQGSLPGTLLFLPWELASISSLGSGEQVSEQKWLWLPLTLSFPGLVYPKFYVPESSKPSIGLTPCGSCCESASPDEHMKVLLCFITSHFQSLSCHGHCKHVTWEGKADFCGSIYSTQGHLLVRKTVEFVKVLGLFFPLIQLCLLAGKNSWLHLITLGCWALLPFSTVEKGRFLFPSLSRSLYLSLSLCLSLTLMPSSTLWSHSSFPDWYPSGFFNLTNIQMN